MAVEDKRKDKFYIKILGEELVVVGDVSEDYVKKLADHINIIGEEIGRTYPRLPRQRILGLTIMNIADEYYKLKEVYNKKEQNLNKLKKENHKLAKQIGKLKRENDELLTLLEEAD
ncbi:MAG: cell division protein ZapA [Halothermotrichaceae bacterium]